MRSSCWVLLLAATVSLPALAQDAVPEPSKPFDIKIPSAPLPGEPVLEQPIDPNTPKLPSQYPDISAEFNNTSEAMPIAVLQGLDKVSARVKTFDAIVGDTVSFGTLQITVRVCRKKPPEETPESAAFLDIDEVRASDKKRMLFSGWMFASSPALSALQHPVYDIWVKDCIKQPGD